jgi:hypothetical protein
VHCLRHTRLSALPKAVTDKRGPTDKFRERVGVKTKDTITYRDFSSRGQVVQNRGKEIKGAKPEDLDRQEALLAKGSQWSASTARSRAEMGVSLMTARAASEEGGGEIGAFTRVGMAAQNIPDIKEGALSLRKRPSLKPHVATVKHIAFPPLLAPVDCECTVLETTRQPSKYFSAPPFK